MRKSVASGVALVALLAGACGGDDGGGADNQAAIDDLMAEGATEEEATCFLDELGDDADRLLGADESDLSEGDMDEVMDAFTKCSDEAPIGGDADADDGAEDEDMDDESEDSSGDEDASGAGADEAEACLQAAGFQTSRESSAPAELQEAVGMVDYISLIGEGELSGVGSVTYYDGDDDASEALEGEESLSGDDVLIGRVGNAVYSYSGGAVEAADIEACL